VQSFLQDDPYEWSEVGNTTTLHPAAVAALGLLMGAMLVVPRKWSAAPLILLTCLIPAGQRVVIFTLDFTFLRLLIIAAWFRLIARNEYRPVRWTHLDTAVVVWAVVSTVTVTLRSPDVIGTLVNRGGYAFDAIGLYFFFRIQLRNYEDLERVIRAFLVTALPVMAFFFLESVTRYNAFHVFGGVPETTMIRRGRLRCQGAFSHPILAGCFWATLLPLFLMRFNLAKDKLLTIAGSVAAFGIVGFSASSTPIMALAFGAMGAVMWWFRAAMRWVRWVVVLACLALHFVLMDKPIWHLIARIDVVGGSTGYHRYFLMDEAVNRFSEWGALGTPTTEHWGHGLQDVTNHYVLEGVGGGLTRLLAFCALLVLAFMTVGRAVRNPHLQRRDHLIAWTLGICFFAHTMNFFAVSYFNQILLVWYLQLAILGSLFRPPGSVRRRASQRLAPVELPAATGAAAGGRPAD